MIQETLIPFDHVEDFTAIASDLMTYLKRADNADIREEFPNTYKAYTDNLANTMNHLEQSRDRYEIGKPEQFIVSSGSRAVGMCVITCEADTPIGIRPNIPNISGFILNPHRGKGLGRFSIEERMNIVEKNFHSRAWTSVKEGNVASEHLVESVGFKKVNQDINHNVLYNIYAFGDALEN